MRADPIFGRYALTDAGRSTFLTAFTTVKDNTWQVAGKLHRIGGPAIIRADGGGEEWWERGQRHRISGPARVYAGGGEVWYDHGDIHRVGGPAVIYADGTRVWYVRGVYCPPSCG